MIIEKKYNLIMNDFYKITKFDNLEKICNKFNLSKEILIEYNKNSNFENGDYIFIPFKNNIIHIVKPGETLKSIADEYGTTVSSIIDKNKIKYIFIGMKLIIE